MPAALEETSKTSVAADSVAESNSENAEPKRDAAWYADQDPTLYAEAVAHVLTPKRRRTLVTTETFVSIRAVCDKH